VFRNCTTDDGITFKVELVNGEECELCLVDWGYGIGGMFVGRKVWIDKPAGMYDWQQISLDDPLAATLIKLVANWRKKHHEDKREQSDAEAAFIRRRNSYEPDRSSVYVDKHNRPRVTSALDAVKAANRKRTQEQEVSWS
jgi:hypothetical protein